MFCLLRFFNTTLFNCEILTFGTTTKPWIATGFAMASWSGVGSITEAFAVSARSGSHGGCNGLGECVAGPDSLCARFLLKMMHSFRIMWNFYVMRFMHFLLCITQLRTRFSGFPVRAIVRNSRGSHECVRLFLFVHSLVRSFVCLFGPKQQKTQKTRAFKFTETWGQYATAPLLRGHARGSRRVPGNWETLRATDL